jgi:hypothetical protein
MKSRTTNFSKGMFSMTATRFTDVIDRLQQKRNDSGQRPAGVAPESDALQHQLDLAIRLLQLAQRFGVSSKSDVYRIPRLKSANESSQYRIFEDGETEKQQYWLEVLICGKTVHPLPGDIVIEPAPRRNRPGSNPWDRYGLPRDNYRPVIALLRQWLCDLDRDHRRLDNSVAVENKQELTDAIGFLQLCQHFEIRPEASIVQLPYPKTMTVSCHFRVLADHGTENRQEWEELMISCEPVRPLPKSIIVSQSPMANNSRSPV